LLSLLPTAKVIYDLAFEGVLLKILKLNKFDNFGNPESCSAEKVSQFNNNQKR
jgi:hypothetical protein